MPSQGIVKKENWTTRESQIVMLVLGGNMKNEEIGELFGLSANRISQIANSPVAKEIREEFKKRVKDMTLNAVEDKLDLLAKKSVDKLDVTLSADIAATSKAKPNQDRVALKVLEGRNYLRKNGDGPGNQKGGTLFSPEGEKRFLDMMEKANTVRTINPFDEPPVLEAELVEDDEEDS